MIRRFQKEEKSAVLELLARNTPKYFAVSEAADFAAYLDNEVEDYFVMLSDGAIVGCAGINYFPKQNLARLSWDMVHPDQQGQGIGRALTEHRINHVKTQHPTIPKIDVRTSQLTFSFYEKFDFKLIKTEKDFWAKGLDLYHMELKLDA